MKGVARKRLNRPQTVGLGESSAPKPSAPPNFVGDPWILFREDETNSEESRLLARARTLAGLGRIDEAVAACNEVIKRKELKAADWNDSDKVFVHARVGLCIILAQAGRIEEASAAFEDGFLKDNLHIPYLESFESMAFYAIHGDELGDPPSEAAVTPPLRMRDDFNIVARKARAEVSQTAEVVKLRNALLAARRLATYEVLVRESDLTNPALALGEQRRRANRLLTAYERVQEVKQDFKDSNAQLTAARRIKSAARRERQRAKHPPAPRGRPRKAAQP